MKEINLKFNKPFIHIRIDVNVYSLAITHEKEAISF